MPNTKKTKEEIINETLDHIIKNLEPIKRASLFTELMMREDITSKTKCAKIVYSLVNFKSAGIGSRQYWISRGWNNIESEIKAKENMKLINARVKRNSPYSLAFWLKKINPKTGVNYTESEAEYERNSRRPIRKEYWMIKGLPEDEAEQMAISQKSKNNKSGADGSKNRSKERLRAHSHRTVEYWILRGYTEKEATAKVAEAQTLFTLDKCIEKHGENLGKQIWGERQIRWMESLKKSGLHGGYSKISLELFEELNKTNQNLYYGAQEAILKIDNMSYSIDCVQHDTNKIIEFYGDYWHANPKKFKETDRIKKKLAKTIWENDNKKISALTDAGYEVLIIWESEYKQDKKGTIDKCNAFLTL